MNEQVLEEQRAFWMKVTDGRPVALTEITLFLNNETLVYAYKAIEAWPNKAEDRRSERANWKEALEAAGFQDVIADAIITAKWGQW